MSKTGLRRRPHISIFQPILASGTCLETRWLLKLKLKYRDSVILGLFEDVYIDFWPQLLTPNRAPAWPSRDDFH